MREPPHDRGSRAHLMSRIGPLGQDEEPLGRLLEDVRMIEDLITLDPNPFGCSNRLRSRQDRCEILRAARCDEIVECSSVEVW